MPVNIFSAVSSRAEDLVLSSPAGVPRRGQTSRRLADDGGAADLTTEGLLSVISVNSKGSGCTESEIWSFKTRSNGKSNFTSFA
jgi:hypothetical protein